MASQAGNFSIQEFTDAGLPLVGGRVYTYTFGTTTFKTAYTDQAGLVPHTYTSDGAGGQYIALNARGELPAPLYLAPGSYDITLKRADGSTIWTRRADPIDDSGSGAVGALRADLLDTTNVAKNDALVATKNTASGGVARTQHARNEEEIRSTDFGTLQDAFNAAANKTLRVIGAYTITAAIAVPSNARIILEGSISTSTPAISILDCAGKSNIHIFGPGKLASSVVSVNGSIGSVDFNGAIDCLVMGVEFGGYEWHGVRMNSATRCHAFMNRIRDGVSSNQDSAGVGVMRNCVDCSVVNNRITNAGWHGVLVQDPGGATVPLNTKVEGNTIDGAAAYGVAVYMSTSANTYTHVTGNVIRNITGVSPGGGGGMGIYVVGAGGCKVKGNTIANICTSTLFASLTPAAIGINGIDATLDGTEISDNRIRQVGVTSGGVSNSTPGIRISGIDVTNCQAPTTIASNVMRQTTVITPALYGMFLHVSSNITVSGSNSIILPTTGTSTGIDVFANGSSVSNINISGVTINGGSLGGVVCERTAAFTISGFSLANVNVTGGGASMIPLSLTGLNKAAIGAGCVVESQTFGLVMTNCLRTRVVDAVITTTGGTAIAMSGTCTGSFIDASVDWGTSSALMSNTSTGGTVAWRSNAIPITGTWAIGDSVDQSVPAVGAFKRARCTAAGTPGTWVSEGNL